MEQVFKYLNDTYQFKDTAIITSVLNDDNGFYFTLDHTIFYPQGGGQPSDIGIISNGDTKYKVSFVAFIDGDIRHYYYPVDIELKNGDQVDLFVQEDIRILNAKNHTAGHLIQAIVESMPNDLIAVKGYHFPSGAYVEFKGTKPENTDLLIDEINIKIKNMIENGSKIITKMVDLDELNNISKNIPEGLPKNKPLRVVIIDGINLAVPCGGTHLNNVNELNTLFITKIKSKKGMVRVSYEFS